MDRSIYYSPQTVHRLRVTHKSVRCPYEVQWFCKMEDRCWVVQRSRGRTVTVVSRHPNPYQCEKAALKELFRLRAKYTRK